MRNATIINIGETVENVTLEMVYDKMKESSQMLAGKTGSRELETVEEPLYSDVFAEEPHGDVESGTSLESIVEEDITKTSHW